MGLDNSIYLHVRQRIDFESTPEYIDLGSPGIDGNDICYELIYFRKSWAFRAMMYDVLAKHGVVCDSDCGSFDFPASVPIIQDIQDGLCHFLKHPSEWDDENQTFFMGTSYKYIALDILILSWVIEQLPNIPNAYLTFSDSW